YVYPQGNQVIMGWVDHGTGAFQVDLPAAPSGSLNRVDHGQGSGPGVQVYSVDSFYDSVGDPRPGPWDFLGWRCTDTSLLTEHGTHALIGGSIAVWVPDASQLFPTDMGPDGKLFTDDDPVGPVGAGWTVFDLNSHPFAQFRTARAEVKITRNELEPLD